MGTVRNGTIDDFELAFEKNKQYKHETFQMPLQVFGPTPEQ
jgi:hypothetical protein